MPFNNIVEVPKDVINKILPFGGITDFYFKRPLVKTPKQTSEDFNDIHTEPRNEESRQIYICPTSFLQYIDTDASFNKIMNARSYLNMIPGIQVREYIIHSRLRILLNLFGAFSQGIEDSKNIQFDVEKLRQVIENKNGEMTDVYKELIQYFSNKDFGAKGWQQQILEGSSKWPDHIKNYVLRIPFFMYYGILTATCTGRYIIPFDGNLIDESSGSQGWHGNDLGLNNRAGWGSGIMGQLMSYLGGAIRFNIQPQWTAGGNNAFPSITVTFNLFNDSNRAAENNYIFVNNLAAKNKYIQYHFFQNNPAAYDIKIEGFNRLFMCSANVKIESKGVKRIPSEYVVKNIMQSMTEMYEGEDYRDNNMIRIPDVYTVSITFTSLLPNSINNYLYRFLANSDMSMDDNTMDVGDEFSTMMTHVIKDKFEKYGVISNKPTN